MTTILKRNRQPLTFHIRGLCSVAIGVALLSLCQPSQAAGLSLGADGVIAVPVGDFADVAAPGVGALVKLELELPIVTLTGRTGLIYHFEKRIEGNDPLYIDTTTYNLPLWVGAKLSLLGPIYARAELGPNYVGASTTDSAISDTTAESAGNDGYPPPFDDNDSTAKAQLGANIGAGISLGPLDAGVELLSYNLGDYVQNLSALAYAGFTF